ncbi:hypothetical protein HanOQP8_Chr12g0447961 [Helianthus annuus]|nr:hypothetical protein HanOQP8_Chr12g0447961 [Helianthus annuus]
MKWRFKDQSMSFDLDDNFVFDKTLARALVAHQSPIRPLPEHFLLLGRLCFSWSHGDRKWLVIRRKSDRVIMSLRDALKVPSFDVFDFDLEDQGEDEVPLMKQVASSAQEVRPLVAPDAAEPSGADGASSVPTPTKEAAGSSGSQAGKRSILDDVDDDPEIRKLDEALQFHPSSASLTSKGAAPDLASKPLVRKRKSVTVQIRSSNPFPMPRLKKNKKGSSFSEGKKLHWLAINRPLPFLGGFFPVMK